MEGLTVPVAVEELCDERGTVEISDQRQIGLLLSDPLRIVGAGLYGKKSDRQEVPLVCVENLSAESVKANRIAFATANPGSTPGFTNASLHKLLQGVLETGQQPTTPTQRILLRRALLLAAESAAKSGKKLQKAEKRKSTHHTDDPEPKKKQRKSGKKQEEEERF